MRLPGLVLASLTAATLVAEPCPELPADPNCKTTVFIRNSDLPKTSVTAPRNFRRTDGEFRHPCDDDGAPCPPTIGLESLHASGSAQPTVAGYRWIQGQLPSGMTLVVFDLRQELHGFIGELPVSWYLGRDQINCGKSDPEIARDEAALLASLRTQATIRPVILEKPPENRCAFAKSGSAIDLPVARVRTEKEVIESLGGRYVQIRVADFHAADDRQVDQFVAAVLALPGGSWAHFHCAGGDGRTTTFMAMYDMMRNALLVDVPGAEAILARQHDLGGIDLDSLGSVGWKEEWARQRRALVHAFYRYCREQIPKGFAETFSHWRKRTGST